MNQLVIVGTGGHTKSCIDVIEKEKKYKIAGFVEKYKSEIKKFMGYPILGEDKDLKKIKKKYLNVFLTIGQIRNSLLREKKFNQLISLGFKIPIIISPYAYVSKKSKIGIGTIIMHKTIINIEAVVGNNCIINTNSLIEHEVKIGNNTHISTGAILNGNVQIGNNTFIGSGAIVKEGVKIGNKCIVSMGSIIKKDIKDNQVIKK